MVKKYITSRFARVSAPVQGALWMAGACIILGGVNVVIRHVSTQVPTFEIVFFRNAVQFLFMVPWFLRYGMGSLPTGRIKMHLLRAVVGLAAMMTWFSSVALMPVTEATALNFTTPLFATIGAALFLKEVVRARRWAATAAGFIGAMIILRPGAGIISPVAMLPLAAAALMATSALIVKSLSRTEAPNVVVFYMGAMMTPLSLIPALFVWQTPSMSALGWMVLIGVMATIAHLALTRAFVAADASAVMPFDFIRLPATALLAYMVLGETVDTWTWVGAAVIFSSTIYIARREAAVKGLGKRS